jgi:glycosyltransferase involved in cell wall biosynthesis
MRILWIVPYLPWPTTSGGKLRQYHLLRSLAERGHRITLLVQSKQALSSDIEQHLTKLLERVVYLPRRGLKHPKSLLAALFSPLPLLASVNGLSDALTASFQQLLTEKWDVIQIEHSYTLQPYLATLQQQQKKFLLTEHNIESKLSGATYNKLPWWLKPLAKYDRWRYQRWEKLALGQAQCVIAVTPQDADDMGTITTQPRRVVVNGVDGDFFAKVTPDLHSQRLLFIGNYEYAPNVDAVEWALQDILPLVWQTLPDVRFAVCGYAMPSQWPQRYPDPRIEWRGYLADLTAAQQSAALFLAPLRDGGGSKLKVMEALAASLPLVTTSQGASGLPLRDGVEYFNGETAAQLAKQIIYALQNPDHARAVGVAGREVAITQHDWRIAASQLEAVYREFSA